MTYEQAQDALAARMAQTAAVERRMALKRDGRAATDAMHDAVRNRRAAPGGREWTPEGLKARELALTTKLTGVEIARATGVCRRRAQEIAAEARRGTLRGQVKATRCAAMPESKKATQRAVLPPIARKRIVRYGSKACEQTPEGLLARQLASAEPTLTGPQLANLSGVAVSTARNILRAIKVDRGMV